MKSIWKPKRKSGYRANVAKRQQREREEILTGLVMILRDLKREKETETLLFALRSGGAN